MNIFARLAVVAVLLAACTPASPSPAPASVDGRIFLSTGITDGGQPFALVDGTRIRVSFNDGQIGLSAGCNSMSGPYAIDAGVLRVTSLATTEIGCDPARHDQDMWLATFIGAGPIIQLSGNDLTLDGGDLVITLLDREIAEPDLALVGPTWTVVSIITGDAVSSVPDGVVATLQFSAEGRVSVQTGCNSGGGRFELDGGFMRFVDVAMTEMACDGAAGQMESAVLAVIGADAVAFQVDASVLTLMVGPNGLQLQGS